MTSVVVDFATKRKKITPGVWGKHRAYFLWPVAVGGYLDRRTDAIAAAVVMTLIWERLRRSQVAAGKYHRRSRRCEQRLKSQVNQYFRTIQDLICTPVGVTFINRLVVFE